VKSCSPTHRGRSSKRPTLPTEPRAARPLTVVLAHNRYQRAGGEDAAVEADAALLEARGHRVVRFERDNHDIEDMGRLGQARLAAGTLWSLSSARALTKVLSGVDADVLHVHNTFPMLSASIYSAAAKQRVPVVQTVHNYRLVCAVAVCARDGHKCVECVGHAVPWPAMQHACYHDSRIESAVVVAMQVVQRSARTMDRKVSLFLPVSEHTATALIAVHALPAERVMVRYNFCTPDPGERPNGSDQGYALFAGRLEVEKGVLDLVEAASRVPSMPVLIAGDGPARREAERLAQRLGTSNVTFLGQLPRADLLDRLRSARCLVLPSTWDEPFPMVLVEASALGVPAIASRVGGVPEIVSGATGTLVPPGEVGQLADALSAARADPLGWQAKGAAARRRYEGAFTADRAYDRLLEAYRRVGVGVLRTPD
jgi:glycosyltransferase involved in cell wall biosynthesis